MSVLRSGRMGMGHAGKGEGRDALGSVDSTVQRPRGEKGQGVLEEPREIQ